ncbi:MAG TPA: hypothetical protein VFM35_07465 [Candidatus Binatia bacterium]|nr:hypothetical protein [Candidatus Binatia bacterium]
MLTSIRAVRASLFWRVIYLACTILVFLFTVLDVLELDGFDLPSNQYPAKAAIVSVNDLSDAERTYHPKSVEAWQDFTYQLATYQGDQPFLHGTEELRISRLDSSRAHRYRVALPRSSISDPFPSL